MKKSNQQRSLKVSKGHKRPDKGSVNSPMRRCRND